MSSLRTRTLLSALTAVAAALLLVLVPAPAFANPAVPDDASEAVERLAELTHKAERLTEQWHRARDRLEARRAELQRAKAELAAARRDRAQARAAAQRFRKQVDRFTSFSFRGARLNKVSAVLSSDSAGEFVDRMAALEMLAAHNREAMQRLSAALAQARQAERRAEHAKAGAARAKRQAARIEAQRQQARERMQRQIAKVQQRLEELTAAERETYTSGGITDYVLDVVPGGDGDDAGGGAASDAAMQAVQAALSQQGEPYRWAAEGPDAFDCSGLMMWSYAQAGIELPRSSSQQAQVGRPVSRSELQPGDLIALYSPVSHIGMYVGNGKYVHAPQPGDVVEVVPVPWDEVTAMRRVV